MKSVLTVVLFVTTTATCYAQSYTPGQIISVQATLPSSCTTPDLLLRTSGVVALYVCTDTNTWSPLLTAPIFSGGIIFIDSGTCPTGFAEVTGLNGKNILGTLAANGDIGTTGGSDTITPAGTNTSPTFTGNSVVSSAVSAGTPVGTNGTVSITPLLNPIAWPAGVPTFAGTPFSGVITHTHTIQMQGSATPATTGTHIVNSTATGGSSRTAAAGEVANAPAGAVASITPAGTIAWPAGVPTVTGAATTVGAETFTGSALGTHTHTTTATGTNSAPTFTGTQFDNRSAWVKWIACKKT